jgi:hypothetical protein
MTAAMTAAMAVADLVSVEVLGRAVPSLSGPVAVMWVFAMVSVFGMVVVINIAVEVRGAVKPWSGTDKDAASKPLGAVVAVGSAVIRRDIVVTIGTSRGYADADADLRVCPGSTCCNAESSDEDQNDGF